MDRIAALDLSYDSDGPAATEGMPIPQRVLLVDPALPDEPAGPRWLADASSWTPTGYLLDGLAELRVGELDAERALQVAVAAERLVAKAQAIQATAIARFAALRPRGRGETSSSWAPDLNRYAPDELGCALGISRRAAGQRIRLAYALTQRLPGTLAALHAGQIDAGKAKIVAEGTCMLEPVQALAVEQHVLRRAGHQTHPQLRAATDRAVIRTDPVGAARRAAEQIEQRDVRLYPLGDGVAELAARLPAELATAAYDRICQLAAKTQLPGDCRTADQRRADVVTDLLLGMKTGGGVRAQILILTRETSLLRLDDEPGELVGSGPLPAETVRRIAEQQPGSVWRRLLTDPKSGTVTDLGRSRYRPTVGLDEFVRLRALVCYFPGCRKPATRCDFNHLTPFGKGGDTSAVNAGPACRHHHRMTDGLDPQWTVTQPRPGVYEVTSPTGRSYTSDPQPLLEPSEQVPIQAAERSEQVSVQIHDPPPF